jgi:alpha-D-xyloside xylohydrolase
VPKNKLFPELLEKNLVVRNGTALPHIALAESTAQMDWSKIELVVYAKDATTAKGSIFLPGDSELHEPTLTKENGAFRLAGDPLAGKISWEILLNSEN